MNIMMDPRPTFPEMFHPGDMSKSRDFKSSAKFYTRTSRPTKYIFIDFGLSIRYKPGQERKALPLRGGDKTVPEFQGDGLFAPYDPFPVDVYYLGNLIREQFLRVSSAPLSRIFLGILNRHYENVEENRCGIHEAAGRRYGPG